MAGIDWSPVQNALAQQAQNGQQNFANSLNMLQYQRENQAAQETQRRAQAKEQLDGMKALAQGMLRVPQAQRAQAWQMARQHYASFLAPETVAGFDQHPDYAFSDEALSNALRSLGGMTDSDALEQKRRETLAGAAPSYHSTDLGGSVRTDVFDPYATIGGGPIVRSVGSSAKTMTPGERQSATNSALDRAQRAQEYDTITQPDGTVVQVPKFGGAAKPVTTATGAPVRAVPKGGTTLSPSARANAQGKLVTIQALRRQLAEVTRAWGDIKGGLTAGPGQGLIPTQAGKRFDASVARMSSGLRQLTRTPGEGAMSDYETRLQQAQLPNRNSYEAVTEDSLKNLEDQLNLLETGYSQMLGGQNTADPLGIR